MSENKSTIIVIVLLLIVAVVMNSCNNNLKEYMCEKDGGTFIKNVSHAEQSTCVENKR